MCFKNIYFEVKNKYKNYVVIMKNGIFYNVLGNDCYLLKNIFNYKINSFSDTVKVGFPLNTLNKVINTFDKLKTLGVKSVRSPRRISKQLSEVLKEE